MFFTPRDIEDKSVGELIGMVEDSPYVPYSVKKRVKFTQLIYQMVGYDLSKEMLLFHIDECKHKLIIATAGAGKTSIVSLDILINKCIRYSSINTENKVLIRSQRILALVFNRHNVAQIQNKQENLVNLARANGIEKALGDIRLMASVEATTVHAFCLSWVERYAHLINMVTSSLIGEEQAMGLLNSSVTVNCKKEGLEGKEVPIRDLLNFYNLLKESFLKFEDMDTLSDFNKFTKALDLTNDIPRAKALIIKIFEGYEKIKARRNFYDFSDMLWGFYRILTEFDKPREEIQGYYEYITADEYQDFSPLMSEILRLVAGDRVPLVCIGDEDQCIYGFRGASLDNILKFTKTYQDGKIYSLSVNRRCRENILKSAKFIIEHNKLRFDKNMFSKKEGGSVNFYSYTTPESEIIKIIKQLKDLPSSELDDTVICYRERNDSIYLSAMLEKEGIQFHVESGYEPYSHILFKHYFSVLDILYMPYDREAQLKLNKVLPVTEAQVFEALGYNPKTHKFKDPTAAGVHFAELPWGDLAKKPGFSLALARLVVMSKSIQSDTLNKIMPNVKLFSKRPFSKSLPVDKLMEPLVYNYFNVEKTYKQLISEYSSRSQAIALNKRNKVGVTLSTFHKLKGEEYKNVYIINLDNDTYPGYNIIEAQKYNKELENAMKESEVRLFFVAMTRAKDNLNLFYKEDNPSLYVKWLLDANKEDIKVVNRNEEKGNSKDLLKGLDAFGVPRETIKDVNKTKVEDVKSSNDAKDEVNKELLNGSEIEDIEITTPSSNGISISKKIEMSEDIEKKLESDKEVTDNSNDNNKPNFAGNSFLSRVLGGFNK